MPRIVLWFLILLLLPAVAAPPPFTLAPLAPEVLVFAQGPAAPLQPLGACLGLAMIRDGLTGEIIVKSGEKSFVCVPMQMEARANGQPVTLPMPPVERKRVIYLPMQPLIEALGGTVTLEQGTERCTITLPGKPVCRLPARWLEGTLQLFEDREAELFVINLDGSGLRRLSWHAGVTGVPAISSDGALCACTASGNLYVQPVAGGEVRRLYTASVREDGSHLWAMKPVFAAGGKLLLFHEQVFNDGVFINPTSSRILSIRSDGTEQQLIADGRTISVNKDGTLIAYGRQGGKVHLRTLDGNDREVGPGWWVRLSDDGRRLAYQRVGDTYWHSIAIYEIEGPKAGTTYFDNVKNMDGHPEMWPCFSPDGTRVVYSDGRDGIRTMAIDRTDVRPLTTGHSSDEFPRYTPDGQRVIFYRQNEGLFSIKADGTELRRLHEEIRQLDYTEGFILTPDGTHVLFTMAP